MPGQSPLSNRSLRQLPTKWAVLLVAVLIGYALLQPLLNRQFGWQLPSLASLQQSDPPSAKTDTTAPRSTSPSKDSRSNSGPTDSSPTGKGSSTSNRNPPVQQPAPDSASSQPLRYGLLRETAPEDFLSPAGLRYTRGSAEGHRLEHIERHLVDDPDRPGKHGVFDGDMPQVLRWLDEAYTRAKNGDKGTSHREEEGRLVYEVTFAKPVGYIGGRDGRRDNHPAARRIRMVVDGNRLITAFPF